MSRPLHLFEAVGIEIEYMIVHRDTLSVNACAPEVLEALAGEPTMSYHTGAYAWSNELVAHVLELKTAEPVADARAHTEGLAEAVRAMNEALATFDCRLMPTGAHPWMNPVHDTVLWDREEADIYATFDRLFNCRRHGWANLQSMHINLPFHGDEEFGRLHAAVRLLLPLLPALAASTPVLEGIVTGDEDSRMEVYRNNSSRYPAITGRVIPEACFTEEAYERTILAPLGELIPTLPDAGILEPAWLNARGAIARFDRGSIEIRVIDTQECPAMDLALVDLVTLMLKDLVEERHLSYAEQQNAATETLHALLQEIIRTGADTRPVWHDYPAYFGVDPGSVDSIGGLRDALLDRWAARQPHHAEVARHWRTYGSLSRRILHAVGPDVTPDTLRPVYRELCERLADNRLFP